MLLSGRGSGGPEPLPRWALCCHSPGRWLEQMLPWEQPFCPHSFLKFLAVLSLGVGGGMGAGGAATVGAACPLWLLWSSPSAGLSPLLHWAGKFGVYL